MAVMPVFTGDAQNANKDANEHILSVQFRASLLTYHLGRDHVLSRLYPTSCDIVKVPACFPDNETLGLIKK